MDIHSAERVVANERSRGRERLRERIGKFERENKRRVCVSATVERARAKEIASEYAA